MRGGCGIASGISFFLASALAPHRPSAQIALIEGFSFNRMPRIGVGRWNWVFPGVFLWRIPGGATPLCRPMGEVAWPPALSNDSI